VWLIPAITRFAEIKSKGNVIRQLKAIGGPRHSSARRRNREGWSKLSFCATPYLLEGTKMRSSNFRTTRLAGLALAVFVVMLQSHDRNLTGSTDEHPSPNQRTLGNVADLKLPLNFEANHGQTDSQVKFLARGNGYNLFLTATEAVLRLRTADRGLRIAEPTLNQSAIRNPANEAGQRQPRFADRRVG
jgi:hypothetical protein